MENNTLSCFRNRYIFLVGSKDFSIVIFQVYREIKQLFRIYKRQLAIEKFKHSMTDKNPIKYPIVKQYMELNIKLDYHIAISYHVISLQVSNIKIKSYTSNIIFPDRCRNL